MKQQVKCQHCGKSFPLEEGLKHEAEEVRKKLKEEAKCKDPIPPLESMLIQNRALAKEDLLKMRQEIEEELDDAVNYAKTSQLPAGEEVEAEVYAA